MVYQLHSTSLAPPTGQWPCTASSSWLITCFLAELERHRLSAHLGNYLPASPQQLPAMAPCYGAAMLGYYTVCVSGNIMYGHVQGEGPQCTKSYATRRRNVWETCAQQLRLHSKDNLGCANATPPRAQATHGFRQVPKYVACWLAAWSLVVPSCYSRFFFCVHVCAHTQTTLGQELHVSNSLCLKLQDISSYSCQPLASHCNGRLQLHR